MVDGGERLPQARETAEIKASAIDRQACDRRRQAPSLFTASGASSRLELGLVLPPLLLNAFRDPSHPAGK
jgi:hypothetical protein